LNFSLDSNKRPDFSLSPPVNFRLEDASVSYLMHQVIGLLVKNCTTYFVN